MTADRITHHLERAAQVADEMDAALKRAGRLERGDDLDGALDREVVATLALVARTHAEVARAYGAGGPHSDRLWFAGTWAGPVVGDSGTPPCTSIWNHAPHGDCIGVNLQSRDDPLAEQQARGEL